MLTRRNRFVLAALVSATVVVLALSGVLAETRAAYATSAAQQPAATVSVIDPASIPAASDTGPATAPIHSEPSADPAETTPAAAVTVPPVETPLQVADTAVSAPSTAVNDNPVPQVVIAPQSAPVATPAPATPAPATPAPATPAPATPAPATPIRSASTDATASASTTWSLDLYNSRAERWQDPDYAACTAASTESMLNTIADDGSASAFVWAATTSYSTQESILAYERAHMTMLPSSAGSDPHGWRNALNYYGWGSINAGVYRDASYGSFDAAARAAVSAMARTHKPVGILAHAGGHAEFVTGYVVTGADPKTGSMAFSIISVDLTDPLRSDGRRDTSITLAQWRSGGTWVRFSAYKETDSPYTDPIDGHVGRSEWYGKWVILEPVR
jgi:hypothetical protein